MNRDDIIRMAREAGFWDLITKYTKVTAGKNANPEDLVWSDVERFAALVAAAERDQCAKVCEARYMGDNNREDMEAKRCAAAIRSRT